MASTNRRPDRVAEAIREEIALFLADGVKDPRISGLVTVTGVDVTRDLRNAKVFVSVMGSDDERAATMEGIAGLAPQLRGRVGRALQLRLAPVISFKLDESIARAARIEELLAQIHHSAPASGPALTGGAPDAPPPAPDAPSER